MIDLHAPTAADPAVLSVSDLTRVVRGILEDAIGDVWVEGEISNYRRQGSGHHYFTLKDDEAQISCVLFRGDGVLAASGLGARGGTPPDGARVQVHGRLTVYAARGQYQIVVRVIQPKGVGALQARFEALKRQLHAEGLFDPARKKPLPRYPRTVGIVTSPTGAALQDMLHVLHRRAPWVRVLVHPVRVQGRGAAAEIAAAVEELNRWAGLAAGGCPRHTAFIPHPASFLIVLARGGGSLEDLWEFNEEAVARAVAASALPVISAVGHEIDFTIADFAADHRAPTPSAAAEILAPDTAALSQGLDAVRETLTRRLRAWTEQARERLGNAAARPALTREPRRRLDDTRQRLDDAGENLRRAGREALDRLRERVGNRANVVSLLRPEQAVAQRRRVLDTLDHRMTEAAFRSLEVARRRMCCQESLLRVLGPQATLARGFSITTDASGRVLHHAADAPAGSRLRTRVSDGEIYSRVEDGADPDGPS